MSPLVRRRALLTLPGLLGLSALAACGDDSNSVTGRARGEGEAGYISGDGAVEQLPPEERRDPVTLTGKTLDGEEFDLAEVEEPVVVLNTWGSWCPPCIEEMPALQEFWEANEKDGVLLLGLVQRDTVETAQAFLDSREITYPNLADDGGATLRGLQGAAAATPTTLVLDAERRIAARVSGPVDVSTLDGLVADVRAEQT